MFHPTDPGEEVMNMTKLLSKFGVTVVTKFDDKCPARAK